MLISSASPGEYSRTVNEAVSSSTFPHEGVEILLFYNCKMTDKEGFRS